MTKISEHKNKSHFILAVYLPSNEFGKSFNRKETRQTDMLQIEWT